MIKQLLHKLLTGFVFGVGFAVALAAVFFSVEKLNSQSHTPKIQRSKSMQDFQSQSKIAIVNSEARSSEFSTAFIGTLKNNGKDTWRALYVVVELFDKSGKFMDKCATYDGSIVGPGQELNFRVSCDGCRDSPLTKYDHYTIKIEGGVVVSQ